MISQFSSKYRWLSNFVPCTIHLDGAVYNSVEHAYQSKKSDHPVWLAFCQSDVPASVIKMVTSAITKKTLKPERLGKLIAKYNLDPDLQLVVFNRYFHNIKLNLMRKLVKQKFTTNTFYKQMLIDTKDANIQEGNYWGDDYWGIDLKTGKGENHLGRIIMSIRAGLLKKETKPDNPWVITDPNCDQMYKCISLTVFEFKELREINPITHEQKLFTATIDLQEYTFNEMYDDVQSFGYSTQQLMNWLLSTEVSDRAMIAECIFEMMVYSDD